MGIPKMVTRDQINTIYSCLTVWLMDTYTLTQCFDVDKGSEYYQFKLQNLNCKLDTISNIFPELKIKLNFLDIKAVSFDHDGKELSELVSREQLANLHEDAVIMAECFLLYISQRVRRQPAREKFIGCLEDFQDSLVKIVEALQL